MSQRSMQQIAVGTLLLFHLGSEGATVLSVEHNLNEVAMVVRQQHIAHC